MLTLRPYQQEAVDAAVDFLINKSGHQTLQLPTASGKTIIMSEIAKRCYDLAPNYTMIFVTDVTALIGQGEKELKEQWPTADTSVFSASYDSKDHTGQLVFCGIQSVYDKAYLFKDVSVIFIDEIDRASLDKKSMYYKFYQGIKQNNPYVRIVGLTATPWKTTSGTIEGTWICDKISYKIPMETLFKEGFLCPLITPKTSMTADTSNLKTGANGDFDEHEMQLLMDDEALVKAALDDASVHGADRNSCLIFASGVDHAEHIKKIFNDRDERCEVIIGETDSEERRKIVAEFRDFKFKYLVSVGTLTTGFNVKSADMLIILRATQSSKLWLQILGRGLRTHESKVDTLVLDYGGNVERFGDITKIQPPPTKEMKAKAKQSPFKQCFNCGEMIRFLEPSCPKCFVEFGREGSGVNHGAEASTEEIASIERDIRVVPVDRVSFRKHYSHRSKESTFRVTYHRGMEEISDYFDFETSVAWKRNRACKWWYAAVNEEIAGHCPKHLDTALNEAKAFGLKEVESIEVDYTGVKKSSGGNLYGHKILKINYK